ncbi:MAG: 2-hydroxyacyl-CoA dehydratase [Deltaproteobacteria bacterium]|nr:2-hydroxyacyl-CoA dehydratase [Deltaproteobacteria bacterium]
MVKQLVAELLHNRPEQIKKAKETGTPVIGYFPGGYVPEEIIHASGALPLCLCDGSDAPAKEGLSIFPNVICPFARAQVGEMFLKTNPYYNMIDLLIVPLTCQHLKKVGEILEYYGNIKVFKLGIPYQDSDFEMDYYIARIKAMKAAIEDVTGSEITDEKIYESIDIYNRLRELLKNISLLRRDRNVSIDSSDFVALNHASFYVDPVLMTEAMEALYKRLSGSRPKTNSVKPRLLIAGPNLSRGDYSLLKTVEDSGGKVVIEDIFEGIRYYWHNIERNGNPIESIAGGHIRGRVPGAFMRSSSKKRLEFLLGLIEDFHVSGVIWYELLCCEFYDEESYLFNKRLRERGIPMLTVESNYDASEAGPLKTRIDAFIEMIRGGLFYD